MTLEEQDFFHDLRAALMAVDAAATDAHVALDNLYDALGAK